MKRNSITYLLLGAVVAALVVYTLFFWRKQPTEVNEPAVTHDRVPPHPSSETPSKNNVNETYVQRVEELKKSVEKNPSNADHLSMLAALLMDGHQASDAIPYFERAARLQPKNDSLLLDLSVCYSMVKKYDAALEITDRLLHNNSKNLTALYNKGALYATLGKKEDASRWWKKILALAPASEEAKKAKSGLTAIGR